MRYLILLLLPSIALADWRNPPDQVTTNVTGGDQIVQAGDTNLSYGGSRAYGFSHGLGDVAINQCLATQQWGSIIVSRQKVVLNRWCASEVYDAKGLHEVAARMRCTIPEVASLFASESGCLAANMVTPPPVPPEPPPVVSVPDPMPVGEVVEEVLAVVEEQHEEQMEMVVDMQAKISNLEEVRTENRQETLDRREYRRSFAQGIIEKLDAPEE